jgi:hypothetical protein
MNIFGITYCFIKLLHSFAGGYKRLGSVVLQPDISAIPTALDFGSVTIGGWQEGTVSIKNDGAAPLSVSATNLMGANAGEFTIPSGGGAFSLAAGATRNITLRLTPTTPGNKIAALNITSNDPDENPLVVNLTGIGAGADIYFYHLEAKSLGSGQRVVAVKKMMLVK